MRNRALAALLSAAAFVPHHAHAQDAEPSGPATAEAGPSSTFDDAIAAAKSSMTSNPQAAHDQAKLAETYAQGVPNGLAIASWLQAEALTRLGQPEEALPRIAKARRFLTADDAYLSGDLLLTEARALTATGDGGLALASYQEAFTLFDELEESRKVALSLQGIARLYQKARRWDRAIDYYDRSLAAHGQEVMLRYAASNNAAKIMLDQGRHAEALDALAQNLTVAEEIGAPYFLAIAHGLIAETHGRLGNMEDAESALTSARAHDGHASAAMWLPYLDYVEAYLASLAGDVTAAETIFANLFDGYDWSAPEESRRSAHRAAYQHYADTGDYEAAFRHRDALAVIEENATRDAAAKDYDLLNAEFETANKALEIERLEHQQLEERSRFRSIVAVVALVGAASVLGMLLLYLRAVARSREQLAKTNAELIEANAVKSTFLANTSHEIRNPLNAINGYCEVMVFKGMVEGEALRQVNVIWGAGKRLLAIVNDILDVSKMEAGAMTIELAPADVSETLRQVAGMNTAPAKARGNVIHLEIEEDLPQFVTDEGRLYQAVTNLVGNAIKFTKNGAVTIAARSLPGGGLEVSVKDTGIGIPAHQRAKIFENFGQVEGQSRAEYGGTGIGLALVRNVSQLLGGEVTVDSAVGFGSTFTIRLPAEAVPPVVDVDQDATPAAAPNDLPERRPVPRTADGEPDMTSIKLLVAEDRPENQMLIRAMLGDVVASIDVANDGVEAVTMVQQDAYDVVLMDNQMPNMTGEDATRAIRALGGYADLPIIGCTGDADVDAKAKMTDAGMNDIVDKPVTIQVLQNALKRAFADEGASSKADRYRQAG